jgi:hypothetical protein
MQPSLIAMANNCSLAYLLQQHLFQMAEYLSFRWFIHFQGFWGRGEQTIRKGRCFFLL